MVVFRKSNCDRFREFCHRLHERVPNSLKYELPEIVRRNCKLVQSTLFTKCSARIEIDNARELDIALWKRINRISSPDQKFLQIIPNFLPD